MSRMRLISLISQGLRNFEYGFGWFDKRATQRTCNIRFPSRNLDRPQPHSALRRDCLAVDPARAGRPAPEPVEPGLANRRSRSTRGRRTFFWWFVPPSPDLSAGRSGSCFFFSRRSRNGKSTTCSWPGASPMLGISPSSGESFIPGRTRPTAPPCFAASPRISAILASHRFRVTPF